MTPKQRRDRVNEIRDAVIRRDGMEAEGTIKVCDFIEHMENTCDDIENYTANQAYVNMVLEVVEEYADGGAL